MPLSSKWTSEKLRSYRSKMDPLADDLVKEIIESSETQDINALFASLKENDDIHEVELPGIIDDYLLETAKLPDWVDWDLIKKGETVFRSYGPEISLCLLCKSLPEAYSCKNGAMVLHQTGRLEEKNGSLKAFTRRLMETAQFVMNVSQPGGMSDSGNGIVTTQKVRLIHAAIRYYIKKHGWNAEEYGEPINQMDMAGTLQSFSTLTIQGLEIMKIELEEDEKEGYYHIWRLVGHIIGLEDELNVETYQEGLELGQAILDDQRESSQEGHELAMAVCAFMEDILPGNLFVHTPEAIIRHLVGDEIAADLKLDSELNLVERIIPRVMGWLFDTAEDLVEMGTFFEKLIGAINEKLLFAMLNHFNEDKKVFFDIPPTLRGEWKLD